MDYLHTDILKRNSPDWMTEETEKKPGIPIMNPDIALKVNKNAFISVPYVPGLSEDFRTIPQHTIMQVIFKEAKTLKSILLYPKDKIP